MASAAIAEADRRDRARRRCSWCHNGADQGHCAHCGQSPEDRAPRGAVSAGRVVHSLLEEMGLAQTVEGQPDGFFVDGHARVLLEAPGHLRD